MDNFLLMRRLQENIVVKQISWIFITCHPIHRPIHGQYTSRYSANTGSVNCWWNISWLSTIQRGHTSQLSYNIICVFKSERGSWVSVSCTRYCSRGFENSFCSVVRVNLGQPYDVNLLDFCCGSMHVIMLDCSLIPLKGNAIATLIFSKKVAHTVEIIL